MGGKDTPIDESRDDASRMPIRRAEQPRHITARKLTTKEHRFEYLIRPCRQRVATHFLVGPLQDALTQTIWLNKSFHEPDLIQASRQEEARE